MKTKIIDKMDFSDGWGLVCNTINDVAEEVLTKKEFEKVLIAQNVDYNRCDGSDYVLFNGYYFDWKVFKTKEKEIVMAFLDYFTPQQLEKIEKGLG